MYCHLPFLLITTWLSTLWYDGAGSENSISKWRKKCLELLLFKQRISLLIGWESCNLKIIYNIRHSLNTQQKLHVCDILVLLNFADPVYDPCLNSTDCGRIQVVSNSCLRLIYRIRRRLHNTHKLSAVTWLCIQPVYFIKLIYYLM